MRSKIGGKCAVTKTAEKIRNATTGVVSMRATGLIGRLSTHGLSIQPGVPSRSSGGITNVCIRCCSMCIEKIRASASSSSSVCVKRIAPIASANHIAWRRVGLRPATRHAPR